MDDFGDSQLYETSTKEIYSKLADLAQEVGIEKEKFQNELTREETVIHVKIFTKYGRQNAIHSTPSFAINGMLAPECSSGMDINAWDECLDKLWNSKPNM
jgi:predicted DsbA family dithiol-disulfide isomerase